MTFNLAFLIVGLVIYNSEEWIYSQIIMQEVQEWNKGAIIDMINAP
jgi:hypothetical protein